MQRSSLLIGFIQLLCYAYFVGLAYAQNYRSEFGFKIDNDYLINSEKDRYYTHGMYIHFNNALNVDPSKTYFDKKLLELEIGQKIYNPFWSNAPDINTHDRPFSGYSYAAAGMKWFKNEDHMIASKLEVGVIGPSSKAQNVQSSFHKLLKTYYPVAGWEYQIKDELVLNFNLKYFKKITQKRIIDLHYFGDAQVGNFNTNLSLGGLFRFGKFNPINQSLMFNSRINNKTHTKVQKTEIFFFYQPQLYLAIYDASIQGGLFRKDKGPITFDLKPFVFHQTFGVDIAHQRFGFKYAMSFITNEVKSNAKPYYLLKKKQYQIVAMLNTI
jgi:lipid A 3-O-deacylase